VHAIVCIKQIPDPEQTVKMDLEKKTVVREGVSCIINPFDMYAIEEGLRIKEQFGGKVSAVTMGPKEAQKALKEAIAMGVDDAFLLNDEVFAGSDTFVTSSVLANAIRKLGDFDIILCGRQAIDGDTGQVGPGIAWRLKIPQLTYVSKIEKIDTTEKKIVVYRMIERGYEVIEASLPCLLTVVKDINEPRYPTFIGINRANQYKIPLWTCGDLNMNPAEVGSDGSPTEVVRIYTPRSRKCGEIIDTGNTRESVSRLLLRLKEKKVL
jgi:electron transfer flavoprotein beta subunit